MEATIERWEENEEVAMAESLSAEEEEEKEEEGKGRPKNGFHMVSNKSGGTESSYGISGFNSGHVDSTSKNFFGNEIVASEVESLSFRKSVETNPQDVDSMKLKDEELPGFGSSSSKQSIEQSGHDTSVENGKAEHGRVKFLSAIENQRLDLKLYHFLIQMSQLDALRASVSSFLEAFGSLLNRYPTDGENPVEPGPNIGDNAGAFVPSNDYSNGTFPPQDSNVTLHDKRPPTSAQLVGVSQAEPVDKSPEPYPEERLGVVLPVVSGATSIAKAPMPGQLVEASINGVQVPVPSHDSSGTSHDQKSPLPGQSVVSITVTTQSQAPEIDDAGPAETKPRESTTVIITSEGPPIISDPRDAKTFEILKSTVYGGLAEAIASVSIVTSAASAANILALALATCWGGLFIIGHNLWELKVDQSRVTSNETNEQVDRSKKDLKLAAVAASSLICIILLAIGKAYIQNPPKYIKTVLYYVVIGVGAAAGTLPLPQMSIVKPAWKSW
ncbi:hypothetical protein M0R45_010321 [Rubus argutus]|uniref:Uncharacterized protein n=1 Tax=Rubus argutus TaxID=59490 RepID=A0AAW1Y940_RUBAR